MREAIVFEAMRDGFGIDHIKNPMTIGELMDILQDYDEDTLFILSHDNGYTYGSLSNMSTAREMDDGEWQRDEW